MDEVAQAVNRLADSVQELLHERREREHGQRPLRRLGLRSYLEAVPGLAARFSKTVPAERFKEGKDGLAEVSCPCGEVHRVREGLLMLAPCGRAFVWDGLKVWVASPAES